MISKKKCSRLRAAIAIPTYNREDVLINTIKSVLALDPAADQILVIDQTENHAPETQAMLCSFHDKNAIKWICTQPPNLPAARNRALLETDCDIVIFIDDDVVLPQNFVSAHLHNFVDSGISAVAGGVLSPGEKQNGGIPVDQDPRLFAYHFNFNASERIIDIWRVPGCNHSVRREIALEIGGYDQAFIGSAQGEDRDFGYRLAKAGYRITFDPNANLVHLVAPSGGCRTAGNRAFNEFNKLASLALFWGKQLRGWVPKEYIWLLLRTGPFRRENVLNPIWQIISWYSLVRAFIYAKKMSDPSAVEAREKDVRERCLKNTFKKHTDLY